MAAELGNNYISNTYEKKFNFLSYFSPLKGDFLWKTPAIFMGKFLFLNTQLRFVACSNEKSKLMAFSWVQGGLSLKTVTILLNQSKHSYTYIIHECLTLCGDLRNDSSMLYCTCIKCT